MNLQHAGPAKDHFHAVVGLAIKQARTEANLSQDALAKLAGISQSTLNIAENGGACSLMLAAKIAFALDTTIDALCPLDALP